MTSKMVKGRQDIKSAVCKVHDQLNGIAKMVFEAHYAGHPEVKNRSAEFCWTVNNGRLQTYLRHTSGNCYANLVFDAWGNYDAELARDVQDFDSFFAEFRLEERD